MIQLLPNEFIREIEFLKVRVFEIENTQFIDKLLIEFNKNLDIFFNPSFSHLKRIKKEKYENSIKLICLICLDEDYAKIPEHLNNDYKFEEKSFVYNVPKFSPMTKLQYDKWRTYWPINYKKPSLQVIQFHKNEISSINEIMKKTINLAIDSYNNGNKFNSCILIDDKGKELAFSYDNTLRNIYSIDHCIICLMDIFSKKESKINNYFCKNMDLYIVVEPCIMCAMALIHSRIRRVFYCLSHNNNEIGGLNQITQINNMDQLNHKYLVFYNIEIQYCYDKLKEKNISL